MLPIIPILSGIANGLPLVKTIIKGGKQLFRKVNPSEKLLVDLEMDNLLPEDDGKKEVIKNAITNLYNVASPPVGWKELICEIATVGIIAAFIFGKITMDDLLKLIQIL